jgi:hypothetical protein
MCEFVEIFVPKLKLMDNSKIFFKQIRNIFVIMFIEIEEEISSLKISKDTKLLIVLQKLNNDDKILNNWGWNYYF